MVDAPPLPRVTPFLVERAETMCARRLRRHFQGLEGDQGTMLRGRIRDVLVEDARAAHREMGPPNPAAFSIRRELLPEEQALQERAIGHYLALFGDESLRTVEEEGLEWPTEAADGTYRVGGWIDLVGERPDGVTELRQFELWGNPLQADPRHNPTTLLAALRIAKVLRPERLVIRHADLLWGRRDEAVVERAQLRGELAELFRGRLATIRQRAHEGRPTMGRDCATCPFTNGCEALP